MLNLQKLSKRKLAKTSKFLPFGLLIVSFIGFADATYLTARHFAGIPLVCSFFLGCEKVLTSSFATIGPVPIALIGAVYYLTIFLLVIVFLEIKNKRLINLIAGLTGLGFLVSLFLVFLQLFVIGAICLYCIASAITSTLLFIAALVLLKFKKDFNLK